MIDFPVYRNEHRTLAWGGDSARPGRVLVDVPDYVLERHGDQLVRIDEDGHVPRYDLRNMRLEDARAIAAHAETDEVDGHSTREEIVAALAPDVSDARAALEDQTTDDEAGGEYEADDGDGETTESLDPRVDGTAADAGGAGGESDAGGEYEDDDAEESWQEREDRTGQRVEDEAADIVAEANDRAEDIDDDTSEDAAEDSDGE